ncbi:MAG: hypothetical protein PHE55_11740 [Methylococcaceae bacterium]|nr:hypothetical protein [Methylococcaceae bacterium]
MRCLLICALPWMGLMACPACAEQVVIAVIVGKNEHGYNLDKASLARIFLRKMNHWSNRQIIQPINLSTAHPLRRLFSERVLGLEPDELDEFWNDQYFHGIFPPYSVVSEEAAMRFVAESPGSIGYISACAVDGRVKVLLYLTASGVVRAGEGSRYCP